MSRRALYLALCIPGALLPYAFLAQFLLAPGAAPAAFVHGMFAHPVAAAFSVDLLVSCLVFILFVLHEAPRLGLRRPWAYVLATLLVGLSFSLPLFLWQRERALQAGSAP
jgi:hypothetical protein